MVERHVYKCVHKFQSDSESHEKLTSPHRVFSFQMLLIQSYFPQAALPGSQPLSGGDGEAGAPW